MIRLASLATVLAACAAPTTAADDASEACPMTIAAYCDGKTLDCPMTWTAAQQATSWSCGTDALVTLTACGSVHIASIAHIDAGEDFYYGPDDQLYRVEEFINTTQHCLAGSGIALGSNGALACDDPAPRTLCSPSS